ncbi:TonB-dependent receptor [Alteromonas pelagimontana]|uniref:TonB-dependent receptor n=1 Tax=Alteromonas pelagimontana TaxID=1858656 RepID=A0A6M4MAW1_9ALTE|nr:TonB-dependent receptor [Alteromonas pelagimontana]QJR80331.1 TonB-dependent receptor [Alteromonas pelagimontana]
MKITLTSRLLPKATAIACVLASASALAQTSNNDNIETLTITGSRLPIELNQVAASTSVLSEDEIRRSGAVQLTDLLRSLPGVTIAQSGSPGALAEIRVRGSESNHLLVLIDGVVANDIGQGSLIDLAHLTAANVTRIELLRGPQSALWGSGAIGGVLSITTKGAATQNSQSVGGTFAVGSRETTRVNLNASGNQEDFSYSAFADWFETNGDNVARDGDEDDSYRNITTGGGIAWRATDEHTFSANVRIVDYANDYDSTDFSTGLPADADNVTDGQQISTQLSWLLAPSNSDYSSELKLQFREDENSNTTSGTDAGSTTGKRQQVIWVNRYQVNDWQLAGGLEYLQRLFEQRGATDYGDPNQDQHDTTVSAFGEAGSELTDDVFATFSARFDNNSEFDNAVSYRAGLTWEVTRNYSLFGSLGKAIKTPTFTERFGYYPQSFVGNPELKPETSREWEVGARARWTSAWSGEASYFNARLEDEINGYVYDPELLASTAKNILGESRREGIDTELNYQGSSFAVRLAYSYLDATQDEAEITELRRAQHVGSVTVSGDLPVAGLGAYVKLAYTGSRDDMYYPPYPEPATTVGLKPYTLASVNVTYQLAPQWQAALRIDNALGEDYEDIYGYAGEKRRALFSISYQMNP